MIKVKTFPNYSGSDYNLKHDSDINKWLKDKIGKIEIISHQFSVIKAEKNAVRLSTQFLYIETREKKKKK